MATRMQRADGGRRLLRLGLCFSNRVFTTATGERISKENWGEIYTKLQGQYDSLHATLFSKVKARRAAPPRPEQRRIDEDHRVLVQKLGPWLAANAEAQSKTGISRRENRAPARIGQRKSRRLAGRPPELEEGLYGWSLQRL
ncbi:hypothetical protein PWT90_08806 [Aphanocladium album]|nr:hypothetical protein PWT90_08806 [Aphanocladium album]